MIISHDLTISSRCEYDLAKLDKISKPEIECNANIAKYSKSECAPVHDDIKFFTIIIHN